MADVKGESDRQAPFVLDPMRRIIRAVHQGMEAVTAAEGFRGVRVPHLNVFAVVPRGEGMRMSEVASWLQLTPGAVSQLVAHLERLGLAERVPDPEDGRGVIVRPTPAVERGYEACRRFLAEQEKEWERMVGTERWRTFRDVLQEIARAQEAAADQGVRLPGVD